MGFIEAIVLNKFSELLEPLPLLLLLVLIVLIEVVLSRTNCICFEPFEYRDGFDYFVKARS